jgi:hypothetical protein
MCLISTARRRDSAEENEMAAEIASSGRPGRNIDYL